jgi:hypothetical protein
MTDVTAEDIRLAREARETIKLMHWEEGRKRTCKYCNPKLTFATRKEFRIHHVVNHTTKVR